MTPLLSVITPCSRPQNLQRIRPTVPDWAQWIVVHDTSGAPASWSFDHHPGLVQLFDDGAGGFGNEQRNCGVARATGHFLYFLDDDNLMHPRLVELVEDHQESRNALVVQQVEKNGTLRLRANVPSIGNIDTAQVVLPRELVGSHRWPVGRYDADGVFFAAIYREHPERFVFVQEPASYYNALR